MPPGRLGHEPSIEHIGDKLQAVRFNLEPAALQPDHVP